MVSPLSEMVMSKGVANVDFSKLTPALRHQVCEEVGETLMKRGDHEQAAHALSMTASPKLREFSSYFMMHGLPSAAAAYAQYLDDRQHVEQVAAANLHTGNPSAAKRLYSRSRNEAMVRFIEENF